MEIRLVYCIYCQELVPLAKTDTRYNVGYVRKEGKKLSIGKCRHCKQKGLDKIEPFVPRDTMQPL